MGIGRVFYDGRELGYIGIDNSGIPSDFQGFHTWVSNQESDFQRLSKNISKVIFNEPATIILWKDGSKTVVKTQDNEPFDREKGFLMAVMKYLNDGKANFNNVIKEWCV